ncbi:MAG: hypothetical protein JEY99_05905 [Spirochaetales bacterium]|nr:hypothetical protein [Spirochaetales bacterium]
MAVGPRFFTNIQISLPEEEIRRRLGYNQKHNIAGVEELSDLRRLMDEAAGFIEVRGSLIRQKIWVAGEKIFFPDGSFFESRQTAKLLTGCTEALLMGATAGKGIIKEISRLTEAGEMRRVVVYDAAASEIVDAGFNWMRDLVQREVLREGGRMIRHRFSAGYGDLALSNQKYFHKILELKQLNVKLTDDYILVPEKSVTAITGITFGN